jgi:cellulose synthase/poly-beta-1,6-N-acetylglucosamine synthase-like glycosyltransferase
MSLGWIVYAYAGYALVLRVLAFFRSRPVARADIRPALTVIVTVHDGAAEMREKLANLLDQTYPADRVEIVVADDASQDGTDRIAEEFAPRGVRVVRLSLRGGKERAQKQAVASARGEIVVFTDVGTRLEKDGLARIVRSFADASVGCVSSTDRLSGAGPGPTGEGFYVRYEMALRSLESAVGSLVGSSGSLFAVRRELCTDFSDRVQSDFRLVLAAVRHGYRVVCDPEAVGHYRDVRVGGSEFGRKVRTVLRGLTALFEERDMLNPFRYGWFSWQLFSHKVVRWTVPFAMLLALVSSVWLAASSRFFAAAAAIQAGGYAFALLATFFPSVADNAAGRAVHYLVQANLAILVAWLRFLRGDRVVLWNPSAR